MKPIFEKIDLHIYPFWVYFSVGQTDAQLSKNMAKLGYKDPLTDRNGAHAKTLQLPNGSVLIRFYNPIVSSYDLGCIAHEVAHASSFIMSYIGAEFTEASEECYAYLIGYISKCIFDILAKQEKEKKD